MRVSPKLRTVGVVGALVLIFGLGGALFFGALDKAQTYSSASLFDPGALWGFVSHFFSEAFRVITTGHDRNGILYRSYLLQGAATTLEFCFLAMPAALLLGLMLALMSRSKRQIVRLPARGFVEFFRDTPLLVQLLAIYWALTFLGSTFVNPFTAGLATLVLNYAAYECENLRAGIAALDRGQGEAAAALGLSEGKALRLIVIPQMIPIVLPPVINDLIYMFKDSAILNLLPFAIGELTTQTNALGRKFPSLSWQFFLWGGIAYLLLSLPLSRLARAVEQRLKSTAFVPRYDLVTMALSVLGVMAVVGWLCGAAAAGFSVQVFGNAAKQLVFGLLLTLGVLLFTLIVFGVVLYLPRQLAVVLRGGRARGAVRPGEGSSLSVSR
jgi:His/Glu/Gln/Arg/opine family amino acid ABC transporter permease subunit